LAPTISKTLNKFLACRLSNGSFFQINGLQKRISQPTDMFNVSLIARSDVGRNCGTARSAITGGH